MCERAIAHGERAIPQTLWFLHTCFWPVDLFAELRR
jgi:hypothetical protein